MTMLLIFEALVLYFLSNYFRLQCFMASLVLLALSPRVGRRASQTVSIVFPFCLPTMDLPDSTRLDPFIHSHGSSRVLNPWFNTLL